MAEIEHGVSPGKAPEVYPIGFSAGEDYVAGLKVSMDAVGILGDGIKECLQKDFSHRLLF